MSFCNFDQENFISIFIQNDNNFSLRSYLVIRFYIVILYPGKYLQSLYHKFLLQLVKNTSIHHF